MKTKIKENINLIILTILIFILSSFFIVTGDDLTYKLAESFRSFNDVFKFSKGFILSTTIISLIVKYKFLRVILITITFISLLLTVSKIVNKKNKSIMLLMLYLIFLFPHDVFKIFIYSKSFTEMVIPALLSLIYMDFLIKDNLNKINPYVCFILGYIVCLFNPLFSITFTVVCLIELIYKIIKKQTTRNHLITFLGAAIGVSTCMYGISFSKTIVYMPNIVDNLLRNFVPMFYESNIFIFIFVFLLLIASIKVFKYKSMYLKICSILSMIVFITFIVGQFKDLGVYLNYITFVLFNVASIFILYSFTTSFKFKRKITIYYLFKIIYFVSTILQVNLNEGMLIFTYLIDALIILDLINFMLPKNYMYKTFSVVTYFLLISYIYMFGKSFYANEMILTEIKRGANCGFSVIEINKEYKKVFPYEQPIDNSQLKDYLKYYEIESEKSFYLK